VTTSAGKLARRLRDLCEPIAAQVYFAPEAIGAYAELGLDYGPGYFCSRGACLGQAPGAVIAAAFGVFNPEVVVPAVDLGWSKTDAESILGARERGAIQALRRMIGDADTSPAVDILRPAMESLPVAGRALYSGLRSLPFPDEPLGALWRATDYVRERRGDGHIAAWVSAGCDAVEIGLLTELYWEMQLGTYIRTRGWTAEQIQAGIGRLESKGWVKDGAFTDSGREARRAIEETTDRHDEDAVRALGSRIEELFAILEPWTRAILDAKGYPADPAKLMNRE
jgi:hypothetical protein